MNTQELNRNEADMIVRHLTDEAFQEKGVDADYSGELTASICASLDKPFNSDIMNYVYAALKYCNAYYEIEQGTHDDLVFERDTNTSNHAEVLGYTDEWFNIAVNCILDNLNIAGKGILRYSA